MKLIEITRTRKLPYAGTVTVNKGQKVDSNKVVAEMNYYPGMVNRLKVTKRLAIESNKLTDVVCVKQGDFVNKGDIIAFHSQWHLSRVITAPHNGIVGMVSRHLGMVYVRKLTKFNPISKEAHDIEKALDLPPNIAKKSILVRVGQQVIPGQIIAHVAWRKNKMKMQSVTTNLFGIVHAIKNNIVTIKNRQISQNLKAYLSGEIINVEPKWSVTIKSSAYQLNGVYGIGGERSGVLRSINTSKLLPKDINEDDSGKVLFVRGTITKEALKKARDYGVSAVIGASCSLAILREYAGDNFIPGITGSEEVTTGVILIRGFYSNSIDEPEWSRIQALNNFQTSVNGTTHIRAGAIRPEILIFS